MKVELQVTLKGKELWSQGTVFDSSKGPFPSDIQLLINEGSPLIKILPEPVKVIPKKEVVVEEKKEEPVVKVEEKVVEEKKEAPSDKEVKKEEIPVPKVKQVLKKKGNKK